MSQAEKKAAGIVSQEGGYLNTWEFFSTHPATSRRIADIQNGCRSCCKLENLRDAMSMEDFIILIGVTSAARVVIDTWCVCFMTFQASCTWYQDLKLYTIVLRVKYSI